MMTFPICGKIKNVPNHQPGSNSNSRTMIAMHKLLFLSSLHMTTIGLIIEVIVVHSFGARSAITFAIEMITM